MKIAIGYAPHAGQMAFHASEARYRVLCCGRRWGKTVSGTAEGLIQAVECADPKNWRGWFVAPTWDQGRETWDTFFRILGRSQRHIVKHVHKSEHTVTLRSGARLQWRSADKPDSLRGAGLDFLLIDEAAMCTVEAWDTVEPAVGDKMGKVVLISTPKGHNWFEEQFNRGKDPLYRDYASWQFPTNSNPYFPQSVWDDMRRNTPEIVFLQEYEAQFIADAGLVFRKIKDCVGGEMEDWRVQHQYVLGVDLARVKDFTVIAVMDCSAAVPTLVGWERFRELDWVVQVGMITEMARRFGNCPVWLDSTGVGDPVYEALRNMGVQAQGYTFTNISKRNLINRLVLGMEEGQIRFPEIPELVAELMTFEYETLPSGNLRYQGPSRGHDDCVIGLALAYWGATGAALERIVTMADLDPDFRRSTIADY